MQNTPLRNRPYLVMIQPHGGVLSYNRRNRAALKFTTAIVADALAMNFVAFRMCYL